MRKILIATSNPGKLRDFGGAALRHGVEVTGVPDFVCRRVALSILSAAVFFCVVSRSASASSVVVTPPSTTPCRALPSYPTISQAVSGVPAGSTIYICPGTYAEQVVITKKLTLIGVAENGSTGSSATGSNNPVIVSPSGGVQVNSNDLYPYGGDPNQPTAAQILVQTPSNALGTPILVNISNITVDGSNNGLGSCATDLVGIYYQNASGTVNHVTTRFQELQQADFGCQDGLAIYVQSGYGTIGTAVVTVENSSVHDYDKNGITADGSGTTATISGNYIVGIGATALIAQNGIQLSDGAGGKISGNTVTDDVYINSPGCGVGSCTSATGILLYDSGGTSGSHVAISGNTVSNTQGAIVSYTDGTATADYAGTADYNDVTSNKITTSPTAGIYFLDGIDLCSDHNTAATNTVFNSSGAGIHIDGQCTEPDSSTTGIDTTVTNNTVNEACAGVLTGPGTGGSTGNTVSGTTTYNVVATTASGDACLVGTPARAKGRLKPQPRRP